MKGLVLKFPRFHRGSSLEEVLKFETGRRVGALPGHSMTSPRTVFELERDAEVAEIGRMYEAYKLKQRERWKIVAAFWVLTLVVFTYGGLKFGPILNQRTSELEAKATQPAPAVPAAAPVVQAVAAQISASAPVEAASAVEVATVVTSDQEAAVVPEPKGPLPAGLKAMPTQSAVTQVAKADVPVPAAVPARTETASKKLAVTAPTAPVAKEPLAGKAKGEKEQVLFSLETPAPEKSEQSAKTVNVPQAATKGRQTDEPAVAAAKTDQAPTVSKPSNISAEAKTERFGASGVVTLTSGGVVVYDKEKKVHRIVKVGERMPDGALVKSVDTQKSRVSTDRGDVIFE